MQDQQLRQRVNELLDYSPETGVFTWNVRRGRQRAGCAAGTYRNNGYFQIGIDGRVYFSHRLAFLVINGYMPGFIDHINGDPSDNRIENLREATKQENQRNTGKCKSNTTGFKGVTWNKQRQKWHARIKLSGKQIHLGYFATPESASAAYEAAARHHFVEFYREQQST